MSNSSYTKENIYLNNFDPNADPLTLKEAKEAIKDKLLAYPEVIRSIKIPSNDEYVLLSFLIDKINYVRINGYGSLDYVKKKAIDIVKNYDSKLPMIIAKVGVWNPVTNEPNEISQETIKIVDDKVITHNENAKRILDIREKEIEKNQNIKKDDLEHRAKTLLNVEETNILREYIRKKVMLYENERQLEHLKKKENLFEKRKNVLSCILLKTRDNFENKWYDDYLKELKNVGIKETQIKVDSLLEIENYYSNDELLKLSQEELEEKLSEIQYELNNLQFKA